jgi:hypothetical protein
VTEVCGFGHAEGIQIDEVRDRAPTFVDLTSYIRGDRRRP